jgi:ketosteroid isomerase-like protein
MAIMNELTSDKGDDVATPPVTKPSPAELTHAQYLAFANDMRRRWAKGDIEPILALFDDHAVYQLLGSRALIPSAGVRIGKHEIREAWRTFFIDFETVAFQIDDVAYNLPRTAFTVWRVFLRHRGTQVEAHFEGVDHLVWSNGKIIKMTSYFDTALLASLTPMDD